MAFDLFPPRGGAGQLLLLLSLIMLQLSALRVLGECHIRFVIDPKFSNFTLGGLNRLVQPRSGFKIDAPITAVPGQKTAFVGALFSSFNSSSSSCPTSLSSLARGLQNSTWYSNGTDFPYQSRGPFQGIAVQPSQIYGLTAGSTYQPENLLWNVTSTSVAINASSGSIQIRGPASLLQGFLWSQSPYTGDRYDSIAPGSGNFSAAGVISVQRKVVSIHLSSFNLSVTGVGSVTLGTGSGATNYTSITTLTFNGAMTLQADLGCKVYCGDYGRCTTSRGVSSCHCQCGWAVDKETGGACTVATGFCSGFS